MPAKKKATTKPVRRKGTGPKPGRKHKLSKADKNFNVPDKLALPTERKGIDEDLSHYTILIYGREKIGKSTIFSGFPNALFFSTEPGTKGLDIFEFNHEEGGVHNWAIFREGVKLLEKNRGKFEHVVIDTVDRAYDMCLDWVCSERGIEYPGTDSTGTEDFGKSWRAVKQEFTEQIHKLRQAGLGVGFVSHSKEQEVKTRYGDRYTRIFPTMSNQARGVVEALVDFFFYAEYLQVEGAPARILICEGDEMVWAGARSAGGRDFPKFLPMEKEKTYGIIHDAFNGNYSGIAPEDILPTRQTSATAKEFVKKTKARSKGGQSKKDAVKKSGTKLKKINKKK